LEDFDAFLEARLRRVAIQAMLEIIPRHAATQPHVQPSAGEDVQHRAFLGEAHRIVERQDIDQVAEPQSLSP
jgi:hypothetical protein